MKKICLLGSTGSIGTQTLDIVRDNPDALSVVALAANKNVDLCEKQIREFAPEVAVMYDEQAAIELSKRVADCPVRILTGMDGLIEAAKLSSADTVLTAMVGMIGIRPTIAAIEAGKNIALANKETLVCAGHIIIPLVEKMGVSLLPVDSEHSAIFQSLNGENHARMKRIWLTASGGPFRGKSRDELASMTVDDALKHPNWSMGRKITVDSSTLVNKGLEVMEAKWLFGADLDQITVLVHPQSIIHSMVEYEDGAVIGQMGVPDMKLPIQYALFYPDRRLLRAEKLDFFKVGTMTFEQPDIETFTGLKLAYEAAKCGGSMPTVFNAANEMAVAMFLNKQIGFLDIPKMIDSAMNAHTLIENPDVSQILLAEQDTYDFLGGRVVK